MSTKVKHWPYTVVWLIITVICIAMFFLFSAPVPAIACQLWLAATLLTIGRVWLYNLLIWSVQYTFAVNPKMKRGYNYKIVIPTLSADGKKTVDERILKMFNGIAWGICLIFATLFLAFRLLSMELVYVMYSYIHMLFSHFFSWQNFIWIIFTVAAIVAFILFFKFWAKAGMPLPFSKKIEGKDKWHIIILAAILFGKWLINVIFAGLAIEEAVFAFFFRLFILALMIGIALLFKLLENRAVKQANDAEQAGHENDEREEERRRREEADEADERRRRRGET